PGVGLLLHVGLSNVLMASLLAVAAMTLGRLCRRPALTHALWLLVLLKLVTPPLVWVPIPWPGTEAEDPTGPVAAEPLPLAPVLEPAEPALPPAAVRAAAGERAEEVLKEIAELLDAWPEPVGEPPPPVRLELLDPPAPAAALANAEDAAT